ncbi:phage SPO1 DNA polymerase-related protein [Acidothermus cellulolyticus 11B]|jgi:uracil-DNA glycosylase family protein|uniref:Type-4 uracil-DNA glycosylase n=1 Tax=Acidothermus cellulolyticus (strain ATCC 43068 / DSM 8971 / 11B) TaxID=351607 RepID=A0LR34_ACIC1|nr:UdgX family uracil-DNA binding protein [Acidothermus cellulolyticus]ABK51894.1 phage SPO1 DNA polymerase-related protein [Acidothermus cellulolyticus 11B]
MTADYPGAARWVPTGAGLDELRRAARGCQGCPLYRNATQTVFSSGPPTARIVLVGEQPGDQEDRRGAPFVGPAGNILDRALEEVGIDRAAAYVTNAVKHFKFRQDGPGARRIHQTPDQREITACRPWLAAELAIVDPDIIVALGATAGRALFGPDFRVNRTRGALLPWPAPPHEDAVRVNKFFLATIHPSAVLRADDREAAYQGLVADLRLAAEVLG